MTIADHSIFLQGNETGIVLVHGLGGTPVEMKAVARGLHAVGYTVFCCQLAGHCGSEDDILQTGWQDWRDQLSPVRRSDATAAAEERDFQGLRRPQ